LLEVDPNSSPLAFSMKTDIHNSLEVSFDALDPLSLPLVTHRDPKQIDSIGKTKINPKNHEHHLNHLNRFDVA